MSFCKKRSTLTFYGGVEFWFFILQPNKDDLELLLTHLNVEPANSKPACECAQEHGPGTLERRSLLRLTGAIFWLRGSKYT